MSLLVDDGERLGIQAAENPTELLSRPSRPSRTPQALQAPSGEELRQIREASELFKSSSFKLQIDALLPNVRPKATNVPALERFLFSLRDFLGSIPNRSPQHPLSASAALLRKGVAVPYPLPFPSDSAKWTVDFQKPNELTLVGSWANGISVKGKDDAPWIVDVAVEMPQALFQEKDYLDSRFLHKKAFYVASIASAIKSEKRFDLDIFYEAASGDTRLTNLMLVPQKGGNLSALSDLRIHVRLIAVLPADHPIALNRLSPAQCNIRLQKEDSTLSSPTPNYNTTILMSTTARPHLLHVHSIIQDVPSFRDALTLLRIWAQQRGYCTGAEDQHCVAGFANRGLWWQALLAFLVYGGEPTPGIPATKRVQLGRGLSSYQLFRSALGFLSKHNFEKEDVFMKSTSGHNFPPSEYKPHHDAVFVNWPSTVNLLTGVPLVSLDLLRYDAQATLGTLDEDLSTDPFAEVFLEDRRKCFSRFDIVLRVDLSRAKSKHSSAHATAEFGSASSSILHTLCTKLRQALLDRIRAIGVLAKPSRHRPLSQANADPCTHVILGLILDTDNAFRLVDYGPPLTQLDSEEVSDFRKLWGEKVDVRRFKDGRILETVVWDVKEADDRFEIPTLIVQHILQRHLGLNVEQDVQPRQVAFRDALRIPQRLSAILTTKSGQAGFQKLMNVFDDLVKRMKALDEELPLALLSVHPVSPSLRYTSVFVPFALPLHMLASLPTTAHYVPMTDIILQFERSSRWPDDLAAIQKTKLAFLEHMATALMSANPGLKANVVVDHLTPSIEMPDHAVLQITTADGWAFSSRIYHDREVTLFKRALDSSNSRDEKLPDGNHERRYSHESVAAYNRHFIHKPGHHRAVATICHQHSAYAGTVRLVKRWLASHWLLGCHVSEEAVEMLCAGIFLGGRNAPGSKELGFVRMVSFFKDWKWQNGITVPMYRSSLKDGVIPLSSTDLVNASSVSGVWQISTEVDQEGHMWTSSGPSLVAARRVKSLAKAIWNVLQSLETGSVNSKILFAHPIAEYDFVIRCDPAKLNRYYQNVNVNSDFWKYGDSSSQSQGTHIVRVGFDPLSLFFQELKTVFNGVVEFFYDQFGGTSIGGLWHPSVIKVRPFRVLAGYATIPHFSSFVKKEKEQNSVDIDKASIFFEIQRMGEGFIKTIEVHNT